MAYAKVSISDVSKFKSAVENENNAARAVKNALSEIDNIIPRINNEVEAMKRADKECGVQIGYADNTIHKIERKINDLTNELNNCEQYYSESVCVGTDENGNEIWETKYYENPRYKEIISELSELNRIIGELSRLKQLILSQRAHLHNYIGIYTQAVSDMKSAKAEIKNAAQSICNNSEKASSKLEKAIEAIREYMDVSANLVNVPSFASISYGPTTYSFSSVLTTREKIEYSARETFDRYGTHDAFYGVSDRHLSKSNYNLLSAQGKASLEYRGTCGITSVANVLRQLGVEEATEAQVLKRALNLNACMPPNGNRSGGGTSNNDIITIMDSYGLISSKVKNLSLDDVAQCIDSGGAMMMSVKAQYLNENKSCPSVMPMRARCNHWVTVLGVVRQEYTNEILGVYVQDTGGWSSDSKVYISAEKFNNMRNNLDDFTGVAAFT